MQQMQQYAPPNNQGQMMPNAQRMGQQPAYGGSPQFQQPGYGPQYAQPMSPPQQFQQQAAQQWQVPHQASPFPQPGLPSPGAPLVGGSQPPWSVPVSSVPPMQGPQMQGPANMPFPNDGWVPVTPPQIIGQGGVMPGQAMASPMGNHGFHSTAPMDPMMHAVQTMPMPPMQQAPFNTMNMQSPQMQQPMQQQMEYYGQSGMKYGAGSPPPNQKPKDARFLESVPPPAPRNPNDPHAAPLLFGQALQPQIQVGDLSPTPISVPPMGSGWMPMGGQQPVSMGPPVQDPHAHMGGGWVPVTPPQLLDGGAVPRQQGAPVGGAPPPMGGGWMSVTSPQFIGDGGHPAQSSPMGVAPPPMGGGWVPVTPPQLIGDGVPHQQGAPVGGAPPPMGGGWVPVTPPQVIGEGGMQGGHMGMPMPTSPMGMQGGHMGMPMPTSPMGMQGGHMGMPMPTSPMGMQMDNSGFMNHRNSPPPGQFGNGMNTSLEHIIPGGDVPLVDEGHVQLPSGEIVRLPPGGEGLVTTASGEIVALKPRDVIIERRPMVGDMPPATPEPVIPSFSPPPTVPPPAPPVPRTVPVVVEKRAPSPEPISPPPPPAPKVVQPPLSPPEVMSPVAALLPPVPLPAPRFKRMIGVGLQLERAADDPLNTRVSEVVPGLAAFSSNKFRIGDIIVAVDSHPVDQLDLQHVKQLILGQEGTNVHIIARRGTYTFEADLTRVYPDTDFI